METRGLEKRLDSLQKKLHRLGTEEHGRGATTAQKRVLRRFWRVAERMYLSAFAEPAKTKNSIAYY